MANQDEEKWELPAALRITNPQVAQQAAEMQKELAARVNSPFANLSQQEWEKIRATARIRHLSHSLEVIDEELQTCRGRYSVQKLHEAQRALSVRLAENLAIVGRLDLAAKIHPDPEYRAAYEKQAASKSPDLY